MQARRLATVSEQLEQANAQTLQLSTSLKHAHDTESSHKWQREALQRKLAVCEADVRGLEAKLSAAHMENSGLPAAHSTLAPAVKTTEDGRTVASLALLIRLGCKHQALCCSASAASIGLPQACIPACRKTSSATGKGGSIVKLLGEQPSISSIILQAHRVSHQHPNVSIKVTKTISQQLMDSL